MHFSGRKGRRHPNGSGPPTPRFPLALEETGVEPSRPRCGRHRRGRPDAAPPRRRARPGRGKDEGQGEGGPERVAPGASPHDPPCDRARAATWQGSPASPGGAETAAGTEAVSAGGGSVRLSRGERRGERGPRVAGSPPEHPDPRPRVPVASARRGGAPPRRGWGKAQRRSASRESGARAALCLETGVRRGAAVEDVLRQRSLVPAAGGGTERHPVSVRPRAARRWSSNARCRSSAYRPSASWPWLPGETGDGAMAVKAGRGSRAARPWRARTRATRRSSASW